MKPNNETYYNLDSEIDSPYVHWDICNSDGVIVVPSLVTYGESGNSKDDLDKLIKKVIEEYEL